VSDDRRLIEDVIPVDEISLASSREKVGGRKGHPALFHLWWARRPLAAARAAVYATLVHVGNLPEEARSAEFFSALCRWGSSDAAITEARERVLVSNGGASPKVLDMFAGGGAIPLEAARLGCEATAVELNPVAHLIELCMLDYPQRFGPSLAEDICEWGERWVDAAWKRVGHLYPSLDEEREATGEQLDLGQGEAPSEKRRPIAYLWTRTVRCPNPSLDEHLIPLVRQTWLAKKKGRFVALRPRVDEDELMVDWELVEGASLDDLGFDPAGFSKRGKATCFVCGTSVDGDYIKVEGKAGRLGTAPLAAVLVHPSGRGREYLAAGSYQLPDEDACQVVLADLDVEPPEELVNDRDTLNFKVPLYGLARFRDLFTPRQLATLCSLAQGVREQYEAIVADGMDPKRAEAVCAYLALVLDRVADRSSTLCRFDISNEGLTNTYARQALPMVWDFGEANPFSAASGSVRKYLTETAETVSSFASIRTRAAVHRTSATQLPDHDASYDAVITDPPYYDNISYADLSDFFYVWLKRSVGFLYPEHLAGELTPKRREAIVAPYRHEGDKDQARQFYEAEMEAAFREAHRVLKSEAPLVCVYAHKTTLGWAALVEALRRAGFTITEAWPLDTEMPERSIGQGTASLASSIFLVARRRAADGIGTYGDVVADLDGIIAERLERLSDAGVSGSDLVIATIGAGLQAFTRYSSVELPNGEEVPAESFLEDVQARVLNAVLGQVHGLSNGVGAIDPVTRYYVIARYSFDYADVEFDEANNLARSAGVELDDLTDGRVPLAKISKGKVHFRDYSERGEEPELGIGGDGVDPPLIDVLHGLLWRASNRREELGDYTVQATFEPTKLRLVAQALQGRALRAEGEDKPLEAQACERLLGAWKTLVEENLMIR
jgi:putative DNA methylase